MRKDYRWNWIGGTNGSWSVSNEKRYIYDGMLVVQERNSANTPSVTYTRGNDLSGTLQGAGGISGMLARSQGYSSGSWTTHHFYHADGNGNITYLVNSSQTLGASYKYDPFGGTISSSGTYAGANRYRFSSKEMNVSNGTYYYGYRWYHSNLQRWLNRDPIGEKGGLDLHDFVHNSPTMLVDLWGWEPTCGCKDKNGNPSQGSEVAKTCCKSSDPQAPDNQKPYQDDDTYLLINAQQMYQYGGNNAWGNIVRACLVCMKKHGAGMHEAHMFCYGNATDRTTACQTVWGYTAAVFAATCTLFDQAAHY
jgi:RHS repeat-associated protein